MWIENIQSNFETKLRNNQILLKICPFCGNDRWNCEISIEKKIFHCWICNQKGTLYTFCKLLGLVLDEDNWKTTENKNSYYEKDALTIDMFGYLQYKDYPKVLQAKGLCENDIKRYGIRYADKGKFKGKMIIPLYEGNKLVYALARDLTIKGNYYNFRLDKKVILPYYLGKINKYEIYLCEGVLDAISVNKLGFTSGVLLGTHITKEQIEKVKQFGFDTAIICLDGDMKAKSIKWYDELGKRGLKTKIVLFDGNEDPNDLWVRDSALLERYLIDARKVTLEDRVTCIL